MNGIAEEYGYPVGTQQTLFPDWWAKKVKEVNKNTGMGNIKDFFVKTCK